MSVDANKARSIFISAVENCAPDQWGQFLNDACGDDAELRRRVELLLKAHQGEDSFLDRGDDDEPADVTIDQPPLEKPGTQIGPYKLLEVIGQGGMGVVYRAEQREPLERQVALKIIKPGMDTEQVIARFEAERQALARMDHPHIAHVLDAGATDSGRSYFVMELVPGIPLTEYCDQHELSIRARLELFVSVCQAVQHAHQKGIIHRDLKPSNILVAEHEGTPVPKVIDFGVAKATGGHLTDKTAFTSLGQLVGTPLYMSPEQAGLSGQDVDTRTDVYALGVLLYELLTGEPPLSRERFHEAAYEEIRRVIREEEPSKPSTRISALGDAATTASGHRQATPAHLRRLLEGELDWIVMKALAKDRTRRYETVNAYAKDIQRYLNDEPVEAGPPSAVYRFRKFARRHAVAFLTTSLVAAALLLGLAGTTWEAMRANNEAARAEAGEKRAQLSEQRAAMETEKARNEAAVSQAINEFLNHDLLAQADPSNEPDRDIKLRTILDRAAISLEDRFTDQPLVKAAIHVTLGKTLQSLGEYKQGEQHLEKARQIHARELGAEHPETLKDMESLATSCYRQHRVKEAEELFTRLLETRRRTLPPDHPDVLRSMFALAMVYRAQVRHDEAERLNEEVLETRRRVLGPEHPDTLKSMHNLALVFEEQGRCDEAEKLNREVLEIRRRVLGNAHPDTLRGMSNLAIVLVHQARYDEAEKLQVESLETRRRVLGPEHQDTLDSMAGLARLYCEQGRYAEAEKVYREVLDISRRVQGAEHPFTLTVMLDLLPVYLSSGRDKAAEETARQLLEMERRVFGLEHPNTVACLADLATACLHQHKLTDAEQLYHQVLDILRRTQAPEYPLTLGATSNLAVVYSSQGRHAEAASIRRELLQTVERLAAADARYQRSLPMTYNDLAWLLATCPDAQVRAPQEAVTLATKAVELVPEQGGVWNTLGVARYRAEEWDAASQALHKSIELTSGGDASDFCFLAMTHQQLGNTQEARQWYDKAVAWMEEHKPQNEDLQRFRAEAAELLGIADQPAQPPEAKPAATDNEAVKTEEAASKPVEETRNREDKTAR